MTRKPAPGTTLCLIGFAIAPVFVLALELIAGDAVAVDLPRQSASQIVVPQFVVPL